MSERTRHGPAGEAGPRGLIGPLISPLRSIHHVSSGRCPEVDCAVRSRLLWKGLAHVLASPGDRQQTAVRPSCPHYSAVPGASVVQNEYQPALVRPAKPLHDIEIVVHMQDLHISAGMILMRAHEGSNPTYFAREGQTPTEIILPKHAWITLVSQDEGVGQHLVANDRVVPNYVVVLDESHGCACAVSQHGTRKCKLPQAEAIRLT